MIREKKDYIIFNKPYGVLCQFSDSRGRATISKFGPFPPDVYPAGRLDADSEGLVLLTNDGWLQHHLLEPKFKHPRTYLAQVERAPSASALERLRKGVIIESRTTFPLEVECLTDQPSLWDREVPIRFRKNVPTQWLKISLYEGRNRQIRKMTAAVGHPVLRLVRIGIATVGLHDLKPGESRRLSDEEVVRLRASLED
jgi:23S rRNA pseudouridine2457 synthase